MLANHYLLIKSLHVGAVACSGLLFLARGAGVLAGARWPLGAPARHLSVSIDTVLLGAALVLTMIIQQYPFHDGWLTAKVCLLVSYIVLGSLALKRARSGTARFICFGAALGNYAAIIAVAMTHDPLGPFGGR